MKRGTLMFLKRILLTTLGALGLGALAGGSAFAQSDGNIPAPDIFNDQIACSMNVPGAMNTPMPTVVPPMSMTSPLDDIIGMGTNQLTTTGDNAIPDTVTNGAQTLMDLGYVIPPGGDNCGLGAMMATYGAMNIDANNDGDFLDDGDTIMATQVTIDVAEGYTDLLGKFEAVYGNPGATEGGTLRALQAAQKALDDELKKPAANQNQTTINQLTAARDTAQTNHNKALAAFNAVSSGPIHMAGVAEWKAKMAVTQSIADYNAQVTKTNMALTVLNDMDYAERDATGASTRSKYVPLANTSLVGTVVTEVDGVYSMVAPAQIVNYAGGTETAPVFGTAAVPATGTMGAMASSSTNSNFTIDGKLIVPMEAWDHDGDGGTTPEVLRTTVNDTNGVDVIRETAQNVREATAALKKLRDENANPRFQLTYDEAYRRAKLEQDYYDALEATMLADTVDNRTATQRLQYVDDDSSGVNEPGETTPNPDYVANPITITSRNAAYMTESGKRMGAENDLRSKVSAREMATAYVRSHFSNAQSFYQQLVARREALKAAADKTVADADNPTDAQRTAAADATKALGDARDAKAQYDALYADQDDPKVALTNALLASDGDDGQALVDAISSNYTATADNKDEIDALKGQLTDADGNPIDLTNLGDTEAVTKNTNDITALDGRVADNESDIGQIQTDLYGTTSGQHGDLAACDATGLLNVANCADARSRHNEADIEEVNDKLMQKKEYIDNLAAEIGVDPVTGEGTGEGGHSRIDMNEARSMANADAIADETTARMEADDAALGGRIDAEATARMEADTMLGGRIDAEEMARMEADTALGMRIDTNAADIMSNAGNIMSNEMAIGANAGNITSNANAIASNMNSIGQNRSAISDNRNMIGELSDDLEVVRAGVAASMALAGMPAINGRGIAIGVGSYDGESAFAVGFQIQGEQASFKIGVTSSGGETGASAGVGFNF